jgi:hypothetical protein
MRPPDVEIVTSFVNCLNREIYDLSVKINSRIEELMLYHNQPFLMKIGLLGSWNVVFWNNPGHRVILASYVEVRQ